MEQNPLYVFSCLLVWLLGVKLVWKFRQKAYAISNINLTIAIFSIVYLCIYAFYDTDYYHYLEIFQNVSNGYISHMEDVYLHLALFADGNYSIFRLCIWGSAILLTFLSFKRFELPLPLAALFFLCLIVLKFGYGRVSLALSIATFGYSFIIKPINPKILSIIIGILLLSCSSFFHSSVLFYILLLISSLFAVNTGKKLIYFLILIYPLFIYLFQKYGGQFILQYIDYDESVQGALNYVNNDFKGYEGIGVAIRMFMERLPFFLSLLLAIIIKWKGIHKTMPFYMKSITNLCIFLVLSTFIFSFETSVNTYSLFYRFLYFTMIPMVILVTYCHTNSIIPKIVNIIFWCGFIASFYNLIYSLYCNIVI